MSGLPEFPCTSWLFCKEFDHSYSYARYFLLAGRYPFHGDTLFHLLETIGKSEISWPSNVSGDCEDFLKRTKAKFGIRLSIFSG